MPAQQFLCEPPQEPHELELCSPLATHLAWQIVPDGLEIRWDAPPRSQTTYLSPLQAVAWIWNGTPLPEGGTVPGIWVTGTYLGVLDQRIEITVDQIGDGAEAGVIGVDPIRITWSSIFRPRDDPNEILEFQLNAMNVDTPLPFEITGTGVVDTTAVPGVRITFSSGQVVHRGSNAVFDVEDFDGFHVWRWHSDTTQPPVVVGTYSKVIGLLDPEAASQPSDAWPNATPFARTYALLDRSVFNGNVYHYAITTFDQGFDRSTGATMSPSPFDSPPWDSVCECMQPTSEPKPTLIRVEYQLVNVEPLEWSRVKALYRE